MLPKTLVKWLALGSLGLSHANAIPLASLSRRQTLKDQVPADDIAVYTVDHFIETRRFDLNTLEIICVFYTHNAGEAAKLLTQQKNQLVTLWDVWPCDFYNLDSNDPNSRIRKIMGNPADKQTYFENMSRAYAFMCSGFTSLFTADVDNIPTNGIWGRIEQPIAERNTDFDPPKGKIDIINAVTPNQDKDKDIFNRPEPQKRDQEPSFQTGTNATRLTRRGPPGDLPNCVPAERVDTDYGFLGW